MDKKNNCPVVLYTAPDGTTQIVLNVFKEGELVRKSKVHFLHTYLRHLVVCTLMLFCSLAPAQAAPPLRYRICSAAEGRAYFVNDIPREQITQFTLNLCLDKKDATYEEWMERNLTNIRDAREDLQLMLDSIAAEHSAMLDTLGITLPVEQTVDFIDLDFKDFGNAGGCTSSTHVYLNLDKIRHSRNRCKSGWMATYNQLIWHELWHVISRTNPELRRRMYELLGFHILPEEISIPEEIRQGIIFNPDVERHDAYSTFTIGGQPTDCLLLLYSPTTEYKAGQDINHFLQRNRATYLLALDKVSHQSLRTPDGSWALHHVKEATDFKEIMSNGNTMYCTDPEECIADNFALAVLQMDSVVTNPSMLDAIREILREYTTPNTAGR